MEGSQHRPCEYQTMSVGGVYELVLPSDKPCFEKTTSSKRNWLTFVFRGLQQVELAGAIFYDFQDEKRKERSNPKESKRFCQREK